MDVKEFTKIAVRVASALGQLHKESLLHLNIRPSNIIADPETGDVELRGAKAELAGSTTQEITGQTLLEALPYMSPEQTGRMNRPIDHRSDLYSLGITFYEMLSGELPFHADDTLSWIHCHIARPPRPLVEVAPEVPPALADIIMKLISKWAEDRYQSARGLEVDLKRCLAEYEVTGFIEPFPLGQRDTWDKIQIPAKLYGRESECAQLLSAFEQVVQSGTPELMLVTGYSGIGKTSVVNEVHKPIVRERGFFISGKFEQYKRDIPYFTIAQAFQELIHQILSGNETELSNWKASLQEALGSNGRLIADLIPQLELIIGEQPEPAPVPASEAHNRFNQTFIHFIGAFAKREHPLVIFLDDLQWADLASLKLLQHILTSPEAHYLLLIGAYRNNEVSPSHPLVTTVEALEKDSAKVTTITLGPLSHDHLSEFVVDTFRCHRERAEPLAKLLQIKTDGNPFFFIQFLLELNKEQLVYFDQEESNWRWSMAEIQTKNFADNIVELMVAKLKRLDGATQNAMKLAACIGNRFDTSVLAIIHQKTVEDTHNDLRGAVREGLMLRRGAQYKFLHDRVQQAAYALISEEEHAAVHLQIGRLLLSQSLKDAGKVPDEKAFDIVNQLNVGVALISDTEEKLQVAKLNLQAGAKAKSSSAFVSAGNYFKTGTALLSEQAWASGYELALKLHLELAECECLNGNFDESDRLCSLILEHAKTNIEKSSAYGIKMQIFTKKAEPVKSIAAGLEALQLFDVHIPATPTEALVVAQLEAILSEFHNRRIEDLIDLPMMSDPEQGAIITLLTAIYPSAFYVNPELTDLIVCKMVQISIKYGTTPPSAIGYASLGTALCKRLSANAEGYRFGKLAYDLTDKYHFTKIKPTVANFFGGTTASWSRHLDEQVEYTRIGFDVALETGDIMQGVFNSFNYVTALFLRGDSLDTVHKASAASLDFIMKAQMPYVAGAVISLQRFVQNMRGLTEHMGTYNGDGFDQNAFETDLKAGIPLAAFIYFTEKLMARFIAGRYQDALGAAESAKTLLWSGTIFVISAEYYVFSALTMLALWNEADEETRTAYNATISECLSKLEKWSQSCPPNFAGKFALVQAEHARIENRDADAIRLYSEAIRSFKANRFVQYEAIACELAASFFKNRGYDIVPEAYLKQAHACYTQWGAYGKVRQLETRHPEVFAHDDEKDAGGKSQSSSAEHLDAMTAVKTSQALSSELGPTQLISTLTSIVLEHTGAQRCYLLLPSENAMHVAAEGIADHLGINIHIPETRQDISGIDLPLTLINFVRRTREKVILNDAAINSRFTEDAYITREKPRSLLCFPIMRGNSIVGILYLENKFVRGAFVSRRLVLLEFLAAVSLQNASLYHELALQNAERKEAEDRLRKTEAHVQALATQNGLIPWELDIASKRFTFIGGDTAQWLGYSNEDWLSPNFLQSKVHPDDWKRVDSALAAEDEIAPFSFRMLKSNGDYIQFNTIASHLNPEHGQRALGGFFSVLRAFARQDS